MDYHDLLLKFISLSEKQQINLMFDNMDAIRRYKPELYQILKGALNNAEQTIADESKALRQAATAERREKSLQIETLQRRIRTYTKRDEAAEKRQEKHLTRLDRAIRKFSTAGVI